MAKSTEWRNLLPASFRHLPVDLVTVITVVILTNLVVFLPVVRRTQLRILVGLPLVLFVPGYAFIAVLFPEAVANDGNRSLHNHGIDGLERIPLSFGASVVIVSLLGLVLNFTPWGLRIVPILILESGVTLLFVIIGSIRRRRLPEDERFVVPYRDWISGARMELLEPDTRIDSLLNGVLVICLLLAVVSVGYAVAGPRNEGSYTEIFLLTKGDNGTLVADNYPTDYTIGQRRSLYVCITNHEQQATNYTVIVELQRVNVSDNNSVQVLKRQELHRFQTHLQNNETWKLRHTVTPQMVGGHLRLMYLLYRGDPPSHPRSENAYREVHLWVNVSAGTHS